MQPPERKEAQLTPEQVYRRMLRSTAWVLVADAQTLASGSGALLDRQERLVVTNHHVVAGHTRTLVFFPSYDDRKPVSTPSYYAGKAKELGIVAQVVSSDPGRDLALLQLERLPDGVPALPMVRQSAVPGQKVHSIGASGVRLAGEEGALWRYTSGEVRQVYQKRFTYRSGQTVSARTVETQSPTNPGDSGGPVVNDRCLLLAIVAGASSQDRAVSTFIDVSEVRTVLEGYYRTRGKVWQDATAPDLIDLEELPRLQQELASEDDAVQARAARALGDLGPEAQPAIPALLRYSKTAGPLAAQQIAAALDKIGPADPADIDTLTAALNEGQRPSQLYACRSLSKMGPAGQKALPQILPLCQSQDTLTRQAAVEAVAQLGEASNATPVQTLLKALEDSQASIRLAAVRGLKRMAPGVKKRALSPLLAALADSDPTVVHEAELAVAAMGTLTEEDVPPVQKALQSRSSQERIIAAHLLQKMGSQARAAVPELIAALSDTEEAVRLSVVNTLCQLGPQAQPAVPALVRRLQDGNAQVRTLAATALGRVGKQPGIYPALLSALADSSSDVRSSAEEALRQLGDLPREDAVETARCLQHEDRKVRIAAAVALGKLGSAGGPAVPALEKALGDRSLRVRIAAVEALADIGPAARAAIPTLASSLREDLSPSGEDQKEESAATGLSMQKAQQTLLQSTVWVRMEMQPVRDSLLPPWGGGGSRGLPQGPQARQGSGWVVDSRQRLVLTSSQVVGESSEATVFFPLQRKGQVQTDPSSYLQDPAAACRGVIVASDRQRGLALLQLTRMPAEVRGLPLAKQGAQPGEQLHSVGVHSKDGSASPPVLWQYSSSKVRLRGVEEVRPIDPPNGRMPPGPFAPSGANVAAAEQASEKVSLALLLTQECIQTDSGSAVVNDKLEVVGMVVVPKLEGAPGSACVDVAPIRSLLDRYRKEARLPQLGPVPSEPAEAATPAAYRLAALRGMQRIGSTDTSTLIPVLHFCMQGSDAHVRIQAARTTAALGIKEKVLVRDLLALCQDDETAQAGEESLRKMGKEVVPEIAAQLKTKNRKQVLTAIRALKQMGGQARAALKELRACRTNDNWGWHRDVDRAVVEAIAAIDVQE